MTQSVIQRRFAKLAAASNQKAAKLGATGRLTADDLGIVYLLADGKCRYCGVDVSATGCSFDHIVPFAKGGANVRSNLALSCLTCQRNKFTKSEAEWQQARSMVHRCEVCQNVFKPRWADWKRGYGRTCSRACSGTKGGRSESPAG